MPLVEMAERHQANSVTVLPTTLAHILALGQLPQHHRDPFDRLIIAQNHIEAATIVTRDSAFQNYDCKLIG